MPSWKISGSAPDKAVSQICHPCRTKLCKHCRDIVTVIVVEVVVVKRMFINVTKVQKCTSRSRYS